MQRRLTYAWWKHLLFWGMWLLLLGPAYVSAFGVSLVVSASGAFLSGSMSPSNYDLVDVVLIVILASTLLLIMAVAIYTAWHFWYQSRPFPRLIIWLSVGLLGIPLLSTAGTLFTYVKLPIT